VSLAARLSMVAYRLTLTLMGVTGLLTFLGLVLLQWFTLGRELESALLASTAISSGQGRLLVEHNVELSTEIHLELMDVLPEGELRWLEGGRRYVAIFVEERDLPGESPEEGHHYLVASAPLTELFREGISFALVYGLGAGAMALVARRRMRRAVSEALGPLREAGAAAERLASEALAGGAVEAALPNPTRDEIGQFVSVINRLLREVGRGAERERRFTSHAAHELRTPLTTLRAQVDVTLRRPREPAEYQELIAEMGEQVDELIGLVEGLLTLARLGRGPLTLRREHAGEVLQALAGRAAEVGEDGEIEYAPELLQLAVGNLIQNAERYGGGVTRLATERRGGSVALVVEDAGPGVSDPERAFERFQRLGRSATPGAGLGLALVREIARAHGGDAALEPRPGGGTRALITLPLIGEPPGDQGA
jgi:signal transduction histidine kinase